MLIPNSIILFFFYIKSNHGVKITLLNSSLARETFNQTQAVPLKSLTWGQD